MTDLVSEGEKLVKDWDYAKNSLETAKSKVISAECDLSNATNALGKWLKPNDGKIGETFSVWHGDRLITCEVVDQNTYKIDYRK